MSDDDDKTEEPSERKLRKAREDGNVPKSEDYNGFVGLLIAIITLYILSILYPQKLMDTMGACFESIFIKDTVRYISEQCRTYVGVMSEIGLFSLASGLFASFFSYITLNKGFVIAKEPIKFNIAALDIGANLKNLMNKQNAIGLLTSIGKETLFYGSFAVILLYFLPGMVYQTFCFENCRGNVPIMFIYAIVGAYTLISLIFAGIDVPLKIIFWKSKLKMSHKDIKDEHKETEGSPEAKRAQHQFRHDLIHGAPTGAKNATFFIKGNGKIFGIRYNRDESPAPIIVIAGKTPEKSASVEQIANNMRRLIIDDAEFVKKLMGLGTVGRPVPLEFVKDIRNCIMKLRKFEQDNGPVHPSK